MYDRGANSWALRRQGQRCVDTIKTGRAHVVRLHEVAALLPFNQDARLSADAAQSALAQLDAALAVLATVMQRTEGSV